MTNPAPHRTPGTVFLSYAREDAEAARRVAEALRAQGIEVWFDQSELVGGDAWDRKIRHQIKECTVFVPLISAQTNARAEGYFRREWKQAVERTHDMADDMAFLLPVVVDATVDAVARVPEKFRDVQWTRLSGTEATAVFVQRVRSLLERCEDTEQRSDVGGEKSEGRNQKPETSSQRMEDGKNIQSPMEPVRIGLSQEKEQNGASTKSRVRRIPKSVLAGAAAVILIAIGGSWFLFRTPVASPSSRTGTNTTGTSPVARTGPISSLAVLPFKNYSGDTTQEFLVDGMTDLLTTELSGIGALTVKSHQSARKFKGSTKSMTEIGQELRADAIVEGSVQRQGSLVMINVQLIEALTDRHIWAKNYQRDMTDVFKMQSEVVEAIAREIKVTLSPEQSSRLSSARAVNPAAFQEYLLGRHFLNSVTEEEIKKALEHFTRATKIDPNFALAWVGVADVYWFATDAFIDPTSALANTKMAAQRALELDDSLAEAHTALAVVKYLVEFEWQEAERGFLRAIRAKPSYAAAHWQYGWLLAMLGRQPEALREFQRATELDPLSAQIAVDHNVSYTLTGQYDRAIAQCRKGLELHPNFYLSHFVLGLIELTRGTNFPQAIAELRKARELEPAPSISGWLGYAYAKDGQKEEARKLLAELDQLAADRFVTPFSQALIYLGLGENGKAIDWLEKAYAGRSQWLTWLKVDPVFDPLRADPRFQALFKKMNFPP